MGLVCDRCGISFPVDQSVSVTLAGFTVSVVGNGYLDPACKSLIATTGSPSAAPSILPVVQKGP